MKLSMLKYIIAGVLAVTAVTAGTVAITNNRIHRDSITQNETKTSDETGEGSIGDKLVSQEANDSGKSDNSSLGSALDNNEKRNTLVENTNIDAKETETLLEVANEVADIDGTIIEGVLGIEEVDDSEMSVVYSSDDYAGSTIYRTQNASNYQEQQEQLITLEEAQKQQEINNYKDIDKAVDASRKALLESIAKEEKSKKNTTDEKNVDVPSKTSQNSDSNPE